MVQATGTGGSKTIFIIIFLVIIISSYIIITHMTQKKQSTRGNQQPTTSHETTTTHTSETTTCPACKASEKTIWDFYHSAPELKIEPEYDTSVGSYVYWPVMRWVESNNTYIFYAIKNIELEYNITYDNTTYTLRMNYTLEPNQTVTALCADPNNNIISKTQVHGVYRIDFTANFSDGTWISYTLYVSNKYDSSGNKPLVHFIVPIQLIIPYLPEPGSEMSGLIEATVRTNTGYLYWNTIAGVDPSNTTLLKQCCLYIISRGDVEAAVTSSRIMEWIKNHSYIQLFSILPPEIFEKDYMLVTNLSSLQGDRGLNERTYNSYYNRVGGGPLGETRVGFPNPTRDSTPILAAPPGDSSRRPYDRVLSHGDRVL